MRGILMAACAAGVLLGAGAASAATWTYTGTGANLGSFGTSPGFANGVTYYFELDTALPLGNFGFTELYRQTIFLGDDVYGHYNADVPLAKTLTSFGVQGKFDFPVGHSTDIGHVEFDNLSFLIIGPPFQGDNAATPWTLTISDSATGLPNAIPEPATWAMMITGFALVGASLRRRRLGVA